MEDPRRNRAAPRTTYTRTIIKDTLLEMLNTQSFRRLRVAALCQRAEITRATFYLYFQSLHAVVDELTEDVLSLVQTHASEEASPALLEAQPATLQQLRASLKHLCPLCRMGPEVDKYLPLFRDASLAPHVLQTLCRSTQEKLTPLYMEYGKMSEAEAKLLLLYDIYGTFYMNRSMKWNRDEQWFQICALMDANRLGGLEALYQNPL